MTKNKPIKEIIENRWNKKTKEIIKDNLIMFWSFMGSLIFGTFFMLNESGNITGGVIKEIYSYVNTTFKILIVLFVLIYGYFIIKLIGKE